MHPELFKNNQIRSTTASENAERKRSTPNRNLPQIGEIKWFGGVNRDSGLENKFGFISTRHGDIFFHRSESISPTTQLTEGAKVTFIPFEEKKGKVATSVQVLSGMDDVALLTLIDVNPCFPPDDVMTVVSFVKSIGAVEKVVLKALSSLAPEHQSAPSFLKFWERYELKGPNDQFLTIAPKAIKFRFYKKHFFTFRESLNNLFASVTAATTTLKAEKAYSEINERDTLLAKKWVGNHNYRTPVVDAVMAQMLSARAAEKAAKWIYETIGASVEDISIRQLEEQAGDWLTHDLLIDSIVPVDVKNARRPVSGANFYVEHTIPRFKQDRRNVHVQVAGILSPYLNYENIRKPGLANFKIQDLIFLGETSKNQIDRLIADFGSPEFEIVRPQERTVPNWLFTYPEAWYRKFSDDLRQLSNDCRWPENDEWDYALDDSEKLSSIPALCVAQKALPGVIASRLSPWQVEFYAKLQLHVRKTPDLPGIFFAVLKDFLGQLKNPDSDYSPKNYEPLLYSKSPWHHLAFPRVEPSYPLGAIDPLGLVANLIKTLSRLWENRESTNLSRFSNFRFSGLGILQGREKHDRVWTTIIAYCGGTIYGEDESGKVLLTPDGVPSELKGKCGNHPLIIGDSAICQTCGKLICKQCKFCTKACQERLFAERAKQEFQAPQRRVIISKSAFSGTSDPRWEEIPLEAYETDLRIR